MEYRKLIAFGKSSYVISLPKSWVIQSSLKKGDLISLEENGPMLVLSKKDKETSKKEAKTISVDDKTRYALGREVHSAYIRNHHDIILRGTQLRTKVRDIQGVVQSLIALEVMEQTPDSFVAKDFLDMDTVSIEELLRKMDLVTRTMMKESVVMFKDEAVYESLKERDGDVNRLYFLLYRTAIYNLENPIKAMKNLKMTAMDVLRSFFIAFYVEAIADEVRRSARCAVGLKLSKKQQQLIEKFLEEMYTYYVDVMKTAYSCDVKKSLELSDVKVKFDEKLELLDKEADKTPGLYKVLSRLERMSSSVHNLGRVIYTLY